MSTLVTLYCRATSYKSSITWGPDGATISSPTDLIRYESLTDTHISHQCVLPLTSLLSHPSEECLLHIGILQQFLERIDFFLLSHVFRIRLGV